MVHLDTWSRTGRLEESSTTSLLDDASFLEVQAAKRVHPLETEIQAAQMTQKGSVFISHCWCQALPVSCVTSLAKGWPIQVQQNSRTGM